jgi:phosphocarrier protein FPr
MDGVVFSLDSVPDPVFAQKLVGDGVSVDPTGQLLSAPCDGVISHIHSAGHALTLKTADGLDLMIHIGLDTVQLKGEGFSPLVREGQEVTTGAPLIEFDADFLATHAKSLLTQVLVTNVDKVGRFLPAKGVVRGGKDVLLTLELAKQENKTETVEGERFYSPVVVIRDETGLHARPAAVLASLARQYQSRVWIHRGEDQANAKSVVSIMALEVQFQDEIRISAQGPDARMALEAIQPLLDTGLGDGASKPEPVSDDKDPDAAASQRSTDPNLLLGVPASSGLGVGKVFQYRRGGFSFAEAGRGAQIERQQLEKALLQARQQLDELQAKVAKQADSARAAIFSAHQELLEDPALLEIAEKSIAAGKSAAFAWQLAYSTQADRLARLKNELLAARSADLRDVGTRVLGIITGQATGAPEIPADSILIAEELAPSDTATLDPSRVRGICTVGGGATSHAAILAQALAIPAVAGIEARALELPESLTVILDGKRGHLKIDPDPAEIERISHINEKLAQQQQAELAAAHQGAVTSDNHRVEVVANVGNLEEARRSIELGGEGIGLLRTEFLYLERTTAPGEDEQAEMYASLSDAIENRPMIIRTLDVGGDKPLAYLPMPREENPFLGVRGIRVGLQKPALLRTQLRAILRASKQRKFRIMFPMVSSMDEIRTAKALLAEEQHRLGEGFELEIGVMVEVPSVALMASQFAGEVDFFSIGSNDLTQYTLAMDRDHPQLAAFADAMNPAVLRLIQTTVDAAHQRGKWVGVCGGIASDRQAVPILVGMGVDELSVSVPSIPSIKAEIRKYSLTECRELARRALEQDDAAAVRALVPLDEISGV